MKKIFTLLIGITFSSTILNSQEAPPQAFSFKATIVNKSGAIIANKTVGLQISISKDSKDVGAIIFTETFMPKTNEYGQVDIMIGKGTVGTGDFPTIPWSAGEFYLHIGVDVKGGTAYQPMSITQLLSVPYALYAASGPKGITKGDMQYWNGTDWVMVPVGLNGQVLTLLDDVPTWGGAGEVPNQSPILITNGISDPTPVSFITGGYILSDGGTPVSQRGVCWNTTGSPTIADSKTEDGPGSGVFTSSVTGLTVEKTYYVRAYAVNGVGTGYGNEISFTTSQIRVTGITLNLSSMTLLPDETSQLTETITPSDAYDKIVAWSSSATSVATVSETGLVTAVANGITTVTVTTNDGAMTASCEVRVAQFNLHGIITSNLDLGENKIVSVSGTIQIAEGVTLSVGPGTVIYGNGYEIQNWGSFVAIGNASNKITFHNLNLMAKSGGIYDLQYCVYNSGTIFANWGSYSGGLSLKYSEIYDLTSQIILYLPYSDCFFESNIFKNSYGINIYTGDKKITIKNNRFEQMTGSSIELSGNYGPSENVVVLGNSFMDTGQIQVKITVNGSGKDIDAKNNYWNTINDAVISSMIYDKNDDLACPGYVLFTPFLTSPGPDTP